MKNILFVLFVSLFTACHAKESPVVPLSPQKDKIEMATGLKKLEGERFIINMKYNSTDNFLKKNTYKDFGIESCYLLPEVYEKIQALSPVLKAEKLKLVIYDCYRPLEVQQAMWKIMPDSRYVANPKTGSLHNRGVAIDCALTDENGTLLSFPTGFDSFEEKAAHTYVCSADEQEQCANRDKFKKMMESVGLQSLRTEWWHYQLPNAKTYPLLSIYENKKEVPYEK